MTKKMELPSLENALTEINQIIEQMEKPNVHLDQSLLHFERGVLLIEHCQKMLKDAEQKVQILIKNNDKETLQPYEKNNE